MQVRLSSCFIAAALLLSTHSQAQQAGDEFLVDLSGPWQFRTGDTSSWKLPSAKEGPWTTIHVPGGWESQGFQDHDGYAWYRRGFKLPRDVDKQDAVLHLGRIDDVDEVFVNGVFVGSMGGMPPAYRSAYDLTREYPIPSGILDPDKENVIAIRVYDATGDGGIMDGRVGISVRAVADTELIRLDGRWSFRTGDDPDWAAIETPKEGWVTVTVPGNWEPQGFRGYDGYAWYRKNFFLPARDDPGAYVLVLGKIDDLDATYVNGVQVGHTGSVDRGNIEGHEWQQRREYEVPHSVLRFGDYNVIAVRVYDGTGDGGLFEGPHALYPQAISEGALRKALKALVRRVTGQ